MAEQVDSHAGAGRRDLVDEPLDRFDARLEAARARARRAARVSAAPGVGNGVRVVHARQVDAHDAARRLEEDADGGHRGGGGVGAVDEDDGGRIAAMRHAERIVPVEPARGCVREARWKAEGSADEHSCERVRDDLQPLEP